MKEEGFIAIAVVLMLLLFTTGCYNLNVAWRGQIDIHNTDIRSTTEGKVSYKPTEKKGDARIDAAKEYTDSFKSDSAISAGENSSATKSNAQAPTREEVKAPTQEEVAK